MYIIIILLPAVKIKVELSKINGKVTICMYMSINSIVQLKQVTKTTPQRVLQSNQRIQKHMNVSF